MHERYENRLQALFINYKRATSHFTPLSLFNSYVIAHERTAFEETVYR